MDDFKSPSSVTLGELTRILGEFEEKILNGTSDPEHFLTITEMEQLWSKLNSETKVLYSDMVATMIRNIDERGLIKQKKANSEPEE